MRILMLCAVLSLPLSVHAQNVEIRGALLPLMATNCGAGQTADRFGRLVASAPVEARALFLEVVRAGPSEAVRVQARQEAARTFDRSRAWAERNPDKPHARRWLQQADRGAYVDQAERDADVLYRSNALEGLRLVGERQDRTIITDLVRDQPRLTIAGERALAAIDRR
ncbi:MAG: hypothetical protein ACFB03_15780 [Paracoccaceae bacterium]